MTKVFVWFSVCSYFLDGLLPKLKEIAMITCNHKELTQIIKGVHAKLRESYQFTSDYNQVWNNHLADVQLRKKYSSAMMKLATEFWNNKESRIEWSYKTCLEYFVQGGIERSLLRELKIQRKWSPSCQDELKCLIQLAEKENNYRNFNRRLQLLDVGSCYNPFSQFPIFACTAIDLTPATEDVKQCDFLNLNKMHGNYYATSNSDELVIKSESFDIVVFSLVLEYLPAKEQRVQFCLKAWDLLQNNGLLIIITPDSKSLQHNVPMMKSWKKALEKIGFIRVKYDKLTHLHCMAFRKIARQVDFSTNLNILSELMFIPQDFKKYVSKNFNERTECENIHIVEQLSQLPNENLYQEEIAVYF